MPLRFLQSFLKKPQSTPSNTPVTPEPKEEPKPDLGALALPKFSRVSELNFLLNESAGGIIRDHEERVINAFRFLIYLILVIFSSLTVIGTVLSLKLDQQKKVGLDFVKKIETNSATVKAAKDTSSKINFYKEIYGNRNELGSRARVVFSVPPETAVIRSSLVTADKFTMIFEVNDTAAFASVLDRYLKSNLISEVTIQSAELLPESKKFLVGLQGRFK